MNAIFSHPRIAELRRRRREALERLKQCALNLHRLQESVLPELLDRYDALFREREIALQRATLLAAEIKRREELFRLKLERGERLTEEMITVVHAIVDREFERVKQRQREALDMTAQERERNAADRAQRHNDGDFAKLYRSIVKKLHPDADVASSEADVARPRNEQFWHLAQEAYRERNFSALQSIHDIVCELEDEENNDKTPDDARWRHYESAEAYLAAEVQRLESRLRNEERKLRDIYNNPPYSLRELMESPTWVESERAALQRQIAAKQREYEQARAFLSSINALQSEHPERSSEEQRRSDFANDFMENTYFNFR
jgi:hypothetical protein